MRRKFLNLSIILFLIISLFVFTGCKKDNESIDEISNKNDTKESTINLEDNEFKINGEKYGLNDGNVNSVNKSNTNASKNEISNDEVLNNLDDTLSYKEYDDKIVISYGDSFDVIYHHSNGKITSQICEYTLADESEAKSFLMYLQSSDTISEVKDMNQSKNKVTVIFNESAYKDMTVDSVKASYDLLNDSVENDVNGEVANTVKNETNTTSKVENTAKTENKVND